jgi:ferredoxin
MPVSGTRPASRPTARPALRDGDVEIRFAPSQRSVRVKAGTTLLEAVHLAQLPIASACGADGVCARCGVLILEGASDLPSETAREREIKARNRVDPKLRLACRVTVVSPVTATAPYW